MLIRDGNYGPYVTDGTTTATLHGAEQSLTLDQAVGLLAERRERKQSGLIRAVGVDGRTGRTIELRDNGWGPYLSDGADNVSIYEDPDAVTLDRASEILWAKREKLPTCGFCGVIGHTRRDCAEQSAEIDRQRKRTCSKCGEPGHTARSCATGKDWTNIEQMINAAADDGTLTVKTPEYGTPEVWYRSRTLFDWLPRVDDLKRKDRLAEAADLLVHLVAGEERQAGINAKEGYSSTGSGSTHMALAVVLRKMGQLEAERKVLER